MPSLRRIVILITLCACPLAGMASTPSWVAPLPDAMWDEEAVPTPEVAESEVTMAELESKALGNHPGLFEALAKIDAAIGRSWQAGLAPNPTVGYLAAEVGSDGSAGQQGAFVGQQIIRGGKRQLDRAVACQEVQRLRQEYQAMRRRVLTDVRSTFYDILWLQRRHGLLERFRETNRQAADLARQSVAVGDSAKSDVLLAEIELEQTVSEIVTIGTQLESKWRELARVVGDPRLVPRPLSDEGVAEVPRLEWADVLARITESPRLAAASASLSRAQWALRRAIAEPIPDVNAQIAVQYDFASGDTLTGVQIGLPIPKRNRNQGGIHAARAEIRAARQRLVRLQYQLEKQLAKKYGVYRNAKLQATRMSEKIVPKAEEVVRIAFDAYEAGEINMSDVLNAQRSLLRATLRHQDAQQQLQSAFVEIDGFLLSDSLATDS